MRTPRWTSSWLLALVLVLPLAAASSPVAAASAEVDKFCGASPGSDPAAQAPVNRAQRILDRLTTTRGRVFQAYRTQYDQDRERIIARNKRLPKSQYMKVPPPLTDAQLRDTVEYKKRERVAHASPADEAKARRALEDAKAQLSNAEARYARCKAKIEERQRSAGSKSADALRRIPAVSRLPEERQRLSQLQSIHLAMLETQRKDREVMGPILSAAICAHKDLARESDAQIRTVKRRAKLAGTDPTPDIEVLKEKIENHKLEIVELRRDIKLRRARKRSCGRKLAAMTSCIKDNLRRPGTLPGACRHFAIQLELLGYYRESFE